MNSSIEKIFFAYILSNKQYFYEVMPHYFRNIDIQFVYKVIRNYIIQSDVNTQPPSRKQILEMVQLEDTEGRITKEMLKTMLSVDLSEYDENNFILPKIAEWVTINKIKTGTVDIIEETRKLDNINNSDAVTNVIGKIIDITNNMTKTNINKDDDLGSDFDNPESHVQDSSTMKVSSGIPSLDGMLGGGWDVQTLNILMAETNNGKCVSGDTTIIVKNKNNGEISKVNFDNFFNLSKDLYESR